jgi:hypothetical protein
MAVHHALSTMRISRASSVSLQLHALSIRRPSARLNMNCPEVSPAPHLDLHQTWPPLHFRRLDPMLTPPVIEGRHSNAARLAKLRRFNPLAAKSSNTLCISADRCVARFMPHLRPLLKMDCPDVYGESGAAAA